MLTAEPNLVPPPGDDAAWDRASWWPSGASTGPCCSRDEASSPFPGSRSRRCATRPAPATASPAAFSATSTATGDGEHDVGALRLAMAYGSVMASFNVEDFGTERVQQPRRAEIAARLAAFRRLTHFEEAFASLRGNEESP